MKLICGLTASAMLAAPAALAPGVISTAANEYNMTATADGRLRVFARSEAEFRNARVLMVQGDGPPAPISFTDARYSDTDPHLSADGSELVFISTRPLPDRPASQDLNVWRSSRRADGTWSPPTPVEGVNSAGPELGAERHGRTIRFSSVRRGGVGALDVYEFVDGAVRPLAAVNSAGSDSDYTEHPSGTVAVFWSNRPGGLGDGDLYVISRRGDGWSAPVNLGPAVNSPAFDFTPQFSADGRTLTFASTREGGAGLADLYSVDVSSIPALREALGSR